MKNTSSSGARSAFLMPSYLSRGGDIQPMAWRARSRAGRQSWLPCRQHVRAIKNVASRQSALTVNGHQPRAGKKCRDFEKRERRRRLRWAKRCRRRVSFPQIFFAAPLREMIIHDISLDDMMYDGAGMEQPFLYCRMMTACPFKNAQRLLILHRHFFAGEGLGGELSRKRCAAGVAAAR